MKTLRETRAARVRPRRRARGFTLVELLVVVAIIGVLTTLLVPAVRGLVGVGGRRGGMNTLSSAIEKARLAAVENGTDVYVGFPFSATDQEAAFSSLIVFRNRRADETNSSVIPLSRWMRMPAGVYMESDSLQSVPVDGGSIPRLVGQSGDVDISQLSAIVFDRFGKLRPDDEVALIRIGEKASPNGDFLGNDNNHFLLTIQPLTGRVTVEDRASASNTNSPTP